VRNITAQGGNINALPKPTRPSLPPSLLPSLPSRPSGQTQQLWVLAQQDKSKIAEIFGAENVDAVCRELEGEMEKMRKVESVALAIEKNKGQGEGEKRKEDEEVWRGWVEKVYLPRVAKEKKEGGGWKDEKERVQVGRNRRRRGGRGARGGGGGGGQGEEGRLLRMEGGGAVDGGGGRVSK